MADNMIIALAGNPNSGKTTIFNNLTGDRQQVGNYPGVTVEKKEGICRFGDREITVVDLPGTYSLTAYSVEELVARNFLIDEKPDVVIDIIDASNLERNLYLAVQLIELNVPLVLAYNMSDVAERRGLKFDLEQMSRFFGAPIVPTTGHRDRGTGDLLEAAVAVADGTWKQPHNPVRYGREIEKSLRQLENLIEQEEVLTDRYSSRWLAVKLLENDKEVLNAVDSEAVLALAGRQEKRLRQVLGDQPEIIIADRRYGFISGVCTETVRSTVEARHSMSDRIDAVLTNHVLGLPIFLVLMYLTFQLTFSLGAYPMAGLEWLFGRLSEVIAGFWPKGAESALKSMLIDGVIGGVGGVVTFLPNIMFLFFGIALLEGTGYMARAAFVMDRLMHRIGLHGKSFIPMLTGFGCSVPAILATRILDDRKDRLTTMMIVPLMSCGARLPIYALIIPAFFPEAWRGPMLWLIYVIGILFAVLLAKLLRVTLFKGETTPFVMELPPYRVPTMKFLFKNTWERSWLYVQKAGTVILGVSIVLWAMTTYPRKTAFDRNYGAESEAIQQDYLAAVGRAERVLGVEPGRLTAIADAELARAAAAEQFYPDQEEFQAVAEAADEKLDRMLSGVEGEAVGRFRRTRSAIAQAAARFAEQTAGLDPHALEYAVFLHQHNLTMEDLQQADPAAFRAARMYTQAKEHYDERSLELANARRAEELQHSLAGRIGSTLAPAMKPLGFDWRISTALIGAFAAKEVFVAQIGIVYSLGEGTDDSSVLRSKLAANYSPLVGFCIMLFCLISTPCMATVVMTWRESGALKWALLQLAGLTVIAYLVCLVVYQVGAALAIGT